MTLVRVRQSTRVYRVGTRYVIMYGERREVVRRDAPMRRLTAIAAALLAAVHR